MSREMSNKTEVKTKAVVLLSGGLDSATVLAIAQQSHDVHCLTFEYGQRHEREVECAAAVAERAKCPLIVRKIEMFGGSALLKGAGMEISMEEAKEGEIPTSYVPVRNLIFLSYVVAYAAVIGAHEVFIGANAVDYSGYRDCRQSFLSAFELAANQAAAPDHLPINIRAPLIKMSKAEIIICGMKLGVDYSLTNSCYAPQGDLACGECASCRIRLRGFEEAEYRDPIHYKVVVGVRV